MQTISCPACGEPLSASARFCTGCEMDFSLSDTTLYLKKKLPVQRTPARKASQENGAGAPSADETTWDLGVFRQDARAGLVDEVYEVIEEDLDDELIEHHETWQKVVEHRTPPHVQVVVLPSAVTMGTFHSLLPRFPRKKIPPRFFFWLCLAALLALLLGGTFGVVLSFGSEVSPATIKATQTVLQASPATIALGGIVTLRGTRFTPHGTITFSHDQQSPLLDTGGSRTIRADANGLFSDTFIISPAWTSGMHTLYAADGSSHARIAARLAITGQSALQGPPHLLLSSNTLDFGSGDSATNGSKLFALSNGGGGQLSWQARSNQPWLQISPQKGSIARGDTMTVIVAVERASLGLGAYTANVVFTSNTEQATLKVTLQVTPLQGSHQGILQLSSAALAFTGTAGDSHFDSKTVTIANPGHQKLLWQATLNLQTGFGWLSLEQQSGSVEPGQQEDLVVNTSSRNLSPGTYKGTILFTNAGPQAIQGSPQSIYVSLTVASLCTLNFVPDHLSFTATAGQSDPAAHSLVVSVAQGCPVSQSWKATISTVNGGSWLTINHLNGSTTSRVLVSVHSAGLAAGIYNGTITFTADTGSQMLPVTFTLNALPCEFTALSTLTLQGTAGQSGPVGGQATLGTTGSCPHTLKWSTSSTTASGGSWLNPASSGTIPPSSTSSVTIQANLADLDAGTYTGKVAVTAVDSVNNEVIGTVEIAVTLKVLSQPCTLTSVSPLALVFAATQGSDPLVAVQSLTLTLAGACSSGAAVAASVDNASSGWLSVGPVPLSVSGGNQSTVNATVASSSLAPGVYAGTITLTVTDAGGQSSSLVVSVVLTVV